MRDSSIPPQEIAPIAPGQRMIGLSESTRINVGHPEDIFDSTPST
ncbi:uncharacterized protein G2W53_037114 [Senna tora]|uniref:Uncharacterized protein n=1 Tax=Senna tora TaxID=362788 RepID=A0A834SV84_9FABA|nr:uncharacterized protein G2W53_037114 [Senna tora]